MGFLGRIVGAALILCVSGMASAAGLELTLSGVPSFVQPSTAYPIQVAYTKDSTVSEQRVLFILELRNAATDAVVAKYTKDNGGAGYKGSSGSVQFDVTMPANAEGSYYFKAYASPWSLNRAIVQQYKSYPTNGTWTYLWQNGGYGVTQDVYYLGSLICPKPATDTTYCSGIAFETCVVAYNNYNTQYGHSSIGSMSVNSMKSFRLVWYGVTDAEKLAARAIPEYNIGVEITDWEEAQEGDFIQLWRHSGSGHNPLFVNWIRDSSNNITGVRYWGSQGSTNGIGYNTEYFGTSSAMNRNRFYIGRVKKPRDQADYDWALATKDTTDQLTTVGNGEAFSGWMVN